jgi:hypothetical protein
MDKKYKSNNLEATRAMVGYETTSKDKGLIRDPDKYTQKHQEMCSWFIQGNNAFDFLRYHLCEIARNVSATLEVPAIGRNGFFYGFADIVIKYENETGATEKVLIEAKSTLSDYGAVLRQLRTYATYIAGITKTLVLYDQLQNDDGSAESFFSSQNVLIELFSNIVNAKCYYDRSGKAPVPSGRRSAVLCGIVESAERRSLTFEFLVHYSDEDINRECDDLISSGNFFSRRRIAHNIMRRAGINMEIAKPFRIACGAIEVPCLVDYVMKIDAKQGFGAVIERVLFDQDSFEMQPSS